MNDSVKMMIKGKKFIGEGARRRVYDLGNGNVLKLAKSKYGIRSNRREVRTYHSTSFRVRRYMAKIRDYDKNYQWIVMKKYDVHFPKSKKYKKKLLKVRAKFRRNKIIPYEVVCSGTGRPNFQNLRLKSRGRIVVIDYGNFVFSR
jgi:hypothetical protein